jgi:hypothetical protein
MLKNQGKIIVKEIVKTRLFTADSSEEEPESVTYADSSNSECAVLLKKMTNIV